MISEAEQRAAVVAAARAWKLTPYRPNAAVRGLKGGCDCGTLLIGAFADAGLVPRFEPGHSPMDFHLNRTEPRYLGFVRARLTEFPGPPGLGDVMMFHYGLQYAHGAIVVETTPLTVVHALRRWRMVTEERLTKNSEVLADIPRGRPPALFFTLWPHAK